MIGLLANCGLWKHEASGGACARSIVVFKSPNLRSFVCHVGFFVSLHASNATLSQPQPTQSKSLPMLTTVVIRSTVQGCCGTTT